MEIKPVRKSKWKTGEREAAMILEKKGYEFNKLYHDDNSRNSMPDLQYNNDQYLEITHTKHDQGKEKKIEMRIIENADGTREKIFLHTEVHTIRNIVQELVYDKGPKYPKGDTDLFLFVSLEEMECVKYLLNTRRENGACDSFLEVILDAPFKVVFLCAWNYDKLQYILDEPTLIRFRKTEENQMEYMFI